MKNSWTGVLAAVIAGFALVAGLRAQERAALRAAQQSAAANQVVYEFKDEDEMKAFVQMWNQFSQVRQQLAAYHVNLQKTYTLDPERKILIERHSASPTQPQTSPAPANSP